MQIINSCLHSMFAHALIGSLCLFGFFPYWLHCVNICQTTNSITRNALILMKMLFSSQEGQESKPHLKNYFNIFSHLMKFTFSSHDFFTHMCLLVILSLNSSSV